MYMGVHVSEVTRKGNSDVRVGERLHTYIYLYLPTCEFAQTTKFFMALPGRTYVRYLTYLTYLTLLNFLKYLRHYILADLRAIDPCTGHVHVRVNSMSLLTYQ